MSKTISEIKNFLFNHNIDIITNFNDNEIIFNLASLRNASLKELTFFTSKKDIQLLQNTKAKGCLIDKKNSKFLNTDCKFIIVENPYLAFAHLSNLFYNTNISNGLISKKVNIHNEVSFSNNIQIDSFCIIKQKTKIEKNVIIYGNSVIGPNVEIGKNTIIYSNNTISNTIIGNNTLIQSGCVIGDRGFGFTPNEKIELFHVGNVIIGNNVQIGSNTTIDRALLDSTIIEDKVRIDNLVHVAHGVKIGEGTIIAAQVGIAGSSTLGNNCLIGGQVGISGHLKIGNNVTIAAKSGVTKHINDQSVIAGFPAIDIKSWKKIMINQYKNKI